MMSSERQHIISPSPESQGSSSRGDNDQSNRARTWQLLFVGVVVVMVLITVALSIYRSIAVSVNGFLYFMLGLTVVALGLLEIIMILFVRYGNLPSGKTWFLYFVGGAVILEALFTNIALFQ